MPDDYGSWVTIVYRACEVDEFVSDQRTCLTAVFLARLYQFPSSVQISTDCVIKTDSVELGFTDHLGNGKRICSGLDGRGILWTSEGRCDTTNEKIPLRHAERSRSIWSSINQPLSRRDQTLCLQSQGGDVQPQNPYHLIHENPTPIPLPAPRLPGAFDGLLGLAVFVAQTGDGVHILPG